jgi:hypothetical protein
MANIGKRMLINEFTALIQKEYGLGNIWQIWLCIIQGLPQL